VLLDEVLAGLTPRDAEVIPSSAAARVRNHGVMIEHVMQAVMNFRPGLVLSTAADPHGSPAECGASAVIEAYLATDRRPPESRPC